MDETARAIARDLEESKAARPTDGRDAEKGASRRPSPSIGPAVKITARQKPGGPVVSASTKRPKMGGGA